jgi:hypothetical protein
MQDWGHGSSGRALFYEAGVSIISTAYVYMSYLRLDIVVHSYNPSNSEDRVWEISGSRPVG